ncbi:MAG TPA: hypothetical protein PKK61_05710 [Defluviitaleaceae bacterium]|jgi:hypothetical protein|nr:hypothetical protein [Candidatus Epulonipiscium sp.]HOA80546.1 hypothetical protein [Defluviitaleaceae bacterium]
MSVIINNNANTNIIELYEAGLSIGTTSKNMLSHATSLANPKLNELVEAYEKAK